MILTHSPFVPTPDSKDWDPQSMGSTDIKGNPISFPDMVSYMDKMVGKVVSKIDELGLSENTLIIFTGDNGTDQSIVSMLRGERYPGGKGRTTDNGTHVPLIVRWNGIVPAEKECLDMVDFSDILPTICDAAKIEIPSDIHVDGISFLPQLLGKKGNPRKWIYSWYSPRGNQLKEFTRNTDYKLYSTGEFYNVRDDFFEKTPLIIENLNKDEKQAYIVLKKALTIYSNTGKVRK